MLHSNCDVIQCASLFISQSRVSVSASQQEPFPAPGVKGGREEGLLPESSGSCPTQRKFSNQCKYTYILPALCQVLHCLLQSYLKEETPFCVTELLGYSCGGAVCCRSWGNQQPTWDKPEGLQWKLLMLWPPRHPQTPSYWFTFSEIELFAFMYSIKTKMPRAK